MSELILRKIQVVQRPEQMGISLFVGRGIRTLFCYILDSSAQSALRLSTASLPANLLFLLPESMIRCLKGMISCLSAAGIQEFLQNNSLERVVTPESSSDDTIF